MHDNFEKIIKYATMLLPIIFIIWTHTCIIQSINSWSTAEKWHLTFYPNDWKLWTYNLRFIMFYNVPWNWFFNNSEHTKQSKCRSSVKTLHWDFNDHALKLSNCKKEDQSCKYPLGGLHLHRLHEWYMHIAFIIAHSY